MSTRDPSCYVDLHSGIPLWQSQEVLISVLVGNVPEMLDSAYAACDIAILLPLKAQAQAYIPEKQLLQ